MEWRISDGSGAIIPAALAAMEARVEAIRAGTPPELVWLLEHPPLYTAGTSAKAGDLLQPGRFPVYQTGRGGQYTYHGPGQRVAYVMLDLKERGPDVRRYRARPRGMDHPHPGALQRDGRTARGPRRHLGRRMTAARTRSPPSACGCGAGSRFHGIAINVDPDLSHFGGIVPCGIQERSTLGVTSLAQLGYIVSMPEFDMALRGAFEEVFESDLASARSSAAPITTAHSSVIPGKSERRPGPMHPSVSPTCPMGPGSCRCAARPG